MKKSIKKILLIVLTFVIALPTVACNPAGGEKVDESKTQLYVANYNGGVGEKWLDDVKVRFEADYADYKGTNGKVGVQLMIRHDKSYIGSTILNAIRTDKYEVYFSPDVFYASAAKLGYFKDITDIVTEVSAHDNKTIESKLSADQQVALKLGGKYYALPHYQIFGTNLPYDANLFKAEKLYFSDEISSDGTREFIVNNKSKLSCGPDGVYNTDDDGLPSSMEEMYKLVNQMTLNNVTPFIWTGKSVFYTNYLMMALYVNLAGYDEVKLWQTQDSGDKEIEVVTGFQGDVPITTMTTINKQNAYLLKQSVALYEAIKFANMIFGDKKYFFPGCETATFSHLDAQQMYINSGIDGVNKSVAMLVDGNYWHNEATDALYFEKVKEKFPLTYNQKDFKNMAMPVQVEGTVTEGNGRNQTLSTFASTYAFINANVDETKADLAKQFLQYCYSDQELVHFTKNSSVLRGLNYDISSLLGGDSTLSDYSKSALRANINAINNNCIIDPLTDNAIYNNNYDAMCLSTNTFWSSAGKGTFLYNATADKDVSAKDYFIGMWISKDNWSSFIG